MSIWYLFQSGGWTMWPLLICSLATWAIAAERIWRYRKLGSDLREFKVAAFEQLLRGSHEGLRELCRKHTQTPTAILLLTALDRLDAKDERLRANWMEAVERRRKLINQELKSNLWILGTIGSAAPFVGLFGTVVGILRSFHDMAKSGAGGFSVVAAGISESLIATATGIIVAVLAVLAFNSFQTWLGRVLLEIRVQTEELLELLKSERQHGA